MTTNIEGLVLANQHGQRPPRAAGRPRRVYRTPVLILAGDLRSLTLGGTGTVLESGSGFSHMFYGGYEELP